VQITTVGLARARSIWATPAGVGGGSGGRIVGAFPGPLGTTSIVVRPAVWEHGTHGIVAPARLRVRVTAPQTWRVIFTLDGSSVGSGITAPGAA